jgi:hypothetical protein
MPIISITPLSLMVVHCKKMNNIIYWSDTQKVCVIVFVAYQFPDSLYCSVGESGGDEVLFVLGYDPIEDIEERGVRVIHVTLCDGVSMVGEDVGGVGGNIYLFSDCAGEIV